MSPSSTPRLPRSARPLALLWLLAALPAQAAEWQVDPAASSLGFTGVAQGEEFTGRFQRFAARIAFDADNLAAARFEVDIELASADTANAERDETLLGSEFFDAAAQPTARYQAERFEALGDGRYRALGTLSLKGHSHPVALDFRWTAQPGAAELQGEATLDRTAFAVGSGDWEDADSIAHDVRVHTTLKLRAP